MFSKYTKQQIIDSIVNLIAILLVQSLTLWILYKFITHF